MKAKLKAIWMILTSTGYWVVAKNKKCIRRVHNGMTISECQDIVDDIESLVKTEIDCIDAVNEANRIANDIK